jgi:TRAP transporter TAXI family solute receptor
MNIVRIAIAALLSLSAAASAQDGGKPISIPTISLGTATPGGGFPLYGGAYAEVMNRADPTLSIVPRATKGSFENIPLLEAGQLDIALVAGEPAYEAFQGIGRPPTRLKIISALYSNPGMFVVRADSPYRTIRDLVGKPVAFGARGSGLPVLARYVLDGLGLKQEGDFAAVYLDRAGDGPAMVLDGRVAALWGAGLGWPGFKAMADTPSGARFIVPSAEEIAQIRARHSFLKPMQVAPYSYSRQDVAIDSVGSWSYLLARETLPDDIAYRLAKTLHGAEAQFGARLTQAKESTAANTVASAPDQSLIHPGALKYFREIGLVK